MTDTPQPAPELLRADELKLWEWATSPDNEFAVQHGVKMLCARLREARAELEQAANRTRLLEQLLDNADDSAELALEQANANLRDAEGRYEACYAELAKVQAILAKNGEEQ